jgi:hypothetical protein
MLGFGNTSNGLKNAKRTCQMNMWKPNPDGSSEKAYLYLYANDADCTAK